MIDFPDLGVSGLVKICGLRESAHAVAAVESGADLIGFLFAPSPRRIDPAGARECILVARAEAGARPVGAVGVFVDASVEEINEISDEAELDFVQLHGSTDARPAGLSRPVIRAIRTPPETNAASVVEMIAGQQNEQPPPVAWLVDAYDPHLHGGTGRRADWSLAAEVAFAAPLVLAGGLTPENVGEAIRTVRPLGVDVSSGVETDGRKDVAKITAFVQAARAAFESIGRG
jgi:phosphoribosylanthranilate isomerase